MEQIEDPLEPAAEVVRRCAQKQLMTIYRVGAYSDADDLLRKIATARGKLKPGGIPMVEVCSHWASFDAQNVASLFAAVLPAREWCSVGALKAMALTAVILGETRDLLARPCSQVLHGHTDQHGGACASRAFLVDASWAGLMPGMLCRRLPRSSCMTGTMAGSPSSPCHPSAPRMAMLRPLWSLHGAGTSTSTR